MLRQCTLLAFGCEVADDLIVRKYLSPFLVVVEHHPFGGDFRVAETRVGVVRIHYVGVEHNHILNCIPVGFRKLVCETVEVCYLEGLVENLYGCKVVVRVQFIMAAVREHLLLNFAVENVHTALSPALGFLEFREEGTCHKHTLGLEKKVVALLGPVVGNVISVAMVVHKELGEELRSEGR